MKVLITGGLGFIGSNVAAHLARRGYEVTVLDAHEPDHIPVPLRGTQSSIKWRFGDVTDWETVSTAASGHDAIIHLADPPSFMMYEQTPIESTVATTKAFLNILEAARLCHVGRVVYASTSTIYKSNRPPFSEDVPVRPVELKSLSKKWKEDLAALYSERYELPVTVGFRPFTLYGPGEEGKGGFASVVSLFSWAMMNDARPVLWGDGTQTRDYVYIDDAARLFARALDADIGTCVLNMGSGISHSFNDVVALINRVLGSCLEPEYVPAASSAYAWHMSANVDRLRATLGIVPQTPLEDGIRMTIDSLRTGSASITQLARAQVLFRDILGNGR